MKGKAVNYPFGHGMSYTSFQYSNVEVLASTDSCEKGTSTSAKAGGVVSSPLAACIRAKVTNSGGVSGAELAQLYLQFPASDNPSYSHFISTRINSGRPKGTEWDGAPPPLHPPHPLPSWFHSGIQIMLTCAFYMLTSSTFLRPTPGNQTLQCSKGLRRRPCFRRALRKTCTLD